MRPLRLRDLTAEERWTIAKLAHARTAAARQVERARIVWHASRGACAPAFAVTLRLDAETVRRRVRRCNAEGLAALAGHPRRGRPPTYAPPEVATVIASAGTADQPTQPE